MMTKPMAYTRIRIGMKKKIVNRKIGIHHLPRVEAFLTPFRAPNQTHDL